MLTPRTFTKKKHLALKTNSNTGDHPKKHPRGNSPRAIFLSACFIKKENLVAKGNGERKKKRRKMLKTTHRTQTKRKQALKNTRTIKRFGAMNGKGKEKWKEMK